MKHVELSLSHFEFYCPVTGQQIQGEDHGFTPSRATAFCFLGETCDFEYAAEWVMETYEQCLASVDDDEWNKDYTAFERMIGEKTAGLDNLVCFSVTTSGIACGPVSSTVHFCIDMDYVED